MPWLCGCWIGMAVEVCKIFEVLMSDRPIFCFKTHVLFCSCVKPNQEMVGRHVQQNRVSRFVLHCGVWNSGELLRFKISLNYIPRTSPVPPDLGLSVAAPFSYHNMVLLMKIEGKHRICWEISRSFCIFLYYNSVYVMWIGFHSGFIHLFWQFHTQFYI